jgi:plastocyanin
VLVAACGGPATVDVDVDGGSADVAVLGDVVVSVAPGDTVVLRHAADSTLEDEAPITHAFVGPGEPPPIFVPQGGGLIPTPAVWGPCRGGSAEDVVAGCPIPPVEGPQEWDGRAYWSAGAMTPTETREIALSDDLSTGDHVLTCALHPELRVVLRVDGDGASSPDASAVVAAARAAVDSEAEGDDMIVAAGVLAEGAYVAAFSPQTVRIPVGGSVTWQAGSRAPVDVVFGAEADEEGENPLSLSHTEPADGLPAGNADAWDGDGELRSGFLSADSAAGASASEWTVTFTHAGTYPYASRFGDAMTGVVVVQ